MGNHMWAYMRRLLHALSDAGPQPPAQDLQQLIGPTGFVMWTETTRVPRHRPSPVDLVTTVDTLPVPIEGPPEMEARRPEPVGAARGAGE
jgi:hypothetical protein